MKMYFLNINLFILIQALANIRRLILLTFRIATYLRFIRFFQYRALWFCIILHIRIILSKII